MPVTWTWGRIVGYTLLIGLIYLIAQIGAVIATALVQAILVPGFEIGPWLEGSANDGVAVPAGIAASAMLCVPLAWLLVRRHEADPWNFLAVRKVSGRTLLIACGAMAAFIAIMDPLNVWVFDRPLVPDFMKEVYATARKPALLFVAIVLIAPVTEELLFRGFLFSALRARGVQPLWCIAATAALFTIVHTQYDVHDMVTVLLIGVLLGAARARFESVVPTAAMHALSNAVAFVETALVMR